MFLGEMELALLLKLRAGVALTQDLELGSVLAQLLRETALRRNWKVQPSGATRQTSQTMNVTRIVYSCHCRKKPSSTTPSLVSGQIIAILKVVLMIMMSFICSCRNKKKEPSSIYTLSKIRTIRGCFEVLTLMI